MDGYDSEFEDVLETARTLLGASEDAADLWEANELVGRALSLRPHDADAWLLKCQIQSALDDDFAALAAVEMALRQRPRFTEGLFWRAAVLADLERYEDALRTIDRAFRLVRTGDEWILEDLYYEKAAMLDALGRHEQAVATYEAGLARCPDSAILKAGLEPLRRERVRRTFKVIRGGLS